MKNNLPLGCRCKYSKILGHWSFSAWCYDHKTNSTSIIPPFLIPTRGITCISRTSKSYRNSLPTSTTSQGLKWFKAVHHQFLKQLLAIHAAIARCSHILQMNKKVTALIVGKMTAILHTRSINSNYTNDQIICFHKDRNDSGLDTEKGQNSAWYFSSTHDSRWVVFNIKQR